MASLVEDLRRTIGPVVTTHASRVFLGEERVLKVKRPVDLGFLDYSTLEKRRRACGEEVRINRRLAPDVYRGVAPVLRVDGCHRPGDPLEPEASRRLSEGPDGGRIVDWAVVMRRLPEVRRADRLLAGGELDAAAIDRLARRLARFHEDAATGEGIDEHGTIGTIRAHVEENFEQTEGVLEDVLGSSEAAELRRRQRQMLDEHPARFRRRRSRGRIRDGHGDLRLEHVYFERDPERITIVDGIEFDIAYRAEDTAADVGFLAMDLAWRGAVELAERLLATYSREADDPGLYATIDFWESYRAFVRGKVASLVTADPDVDPEAREAAAEEARRYFLLALAAERRPVVPPILIAIGGWIGSGKSTLARAVSDEHAIPVLEADRVRKRLVGVEPSTPLREAPFAGAYDRRTSERVLGRLLHGAAEIVSSGRTALLDTSLRKRATRRRLQRLSRRLGVPFLVVECRAPAAVCRERLRRREAEGGGASDGRLEIFDRWVETWEPIEELPADEHLVVDTEAPLSEGLARILERIPAWPIDGDRAPSGP